MYTLIYRINNLFNIIYNFGDSGVLRVWCCGIESLTDEQANIVSMKSMNPLTNFTAKNSLPKKSEFVIIYDTLDYYIHT